MDSFFFVVGGGFHRCRREPKLSRLFASTAGEWATRKPPSSEPLHRRFPLRDQVRWAFPPSDLQHGRYGTAMLPKNTPTRNTINKGRLSFHTFCRKAPEHWLDLTSSPSSDSSDTFVIPSESFIHLFIHHSRLRLCWSLAGNNTQLERAEIVCWMITNGSEVLIRRGAASRLARSLFRAV